MGIEIERKFLLRDDSWRNEAADVLAIRQAYLDTRDGLTLRVRIVGGTDAVLTLKTGEGPARGEFEYAIPLADAEALWSSSIGTPVEKRRHRIRHGAHVIEVDVFERGLAPLVVAEIELGSEGEAVELPAWIGREVTGDPAYSNARLALAGIPRDAFETH